MKDKFKYTFKNIFGDKTIYYLTLEEVKKGVLSQILNSGMRENGYQLIDICKDSPV